jgi:hypothetical protein
VRSRALAVAIVAAVAGCGASDYAVIGGAKVARPTVGYMLTCDGTIKLDGTPVRGFSLVRLQ